MFRGTTRIEAIHANEEKLPLLTRNVRQTDIPTPRMQKTFCSAVQNTSSGVFPFAESYVMALSVGDAFFLLKSCWQESPS